MCVTLPSLPQVARNSPEALNAIAQIGPSCALIVCVHSSPAHSFRPLYVAILLAAGQCPVGSHTGFVPLMLKVLAGRAALRFTLLFVDVCA